MKISDSRVLIGLAAIVALIVAVVVISGSTKGTEKPGDKVQSRSVAKDIAEVERIARTIDNQEEPKAKSVDSDTADPPAVSGDTTQPARRGATDSDAPPKSMLPPEVVSPTYLPDGFKLRRFGIADGGKTLLVYSVKVIGKDDGMSKLKAGGFFTVQRSLAPFKSPDPSPGAKGGSKSGGQNASGDASSTQSQPEGRNILDISDGAVSWRGIDGPYYQVKGKLSKSELVRIARSMQH